MKKILPLLFILLFSFSPHVFAQSSYVLPYPPTMPGSNFYLVRQVGEYIEKYWSFGNFAQFSYNLKQSDKYLVEAKTLFEYKQYLLGYAALKKADRSLKQANYFLSNAVKEKKDIREKKTLLRSAMGKHIEVLEILRGSVPEKFLWQPEKAPASQLDIWDAITESITIRKVHL